MADKAAPLSDQPQSPDFEAELPLPIEERPPATPAKEPKNEAEPALHLIRKNLSEAYAVEPELVEEEKTVEQAEHQGNKLSKHQQFLDSLAGSGKSAQEMTAAWHEYYAGLTDHEKQQVWHEFNKLHAEQSAYSKHQQATKTHISPAALRPKHHTVTGLHKAIGEAKRQARLTFQGARQLNPKQGLKSLSFGLTVGGIVIIVFLFGFFNERFIAPFIQPSRTSLNAAIISGDTVSNKPELIIPKINLEVPVVYGVTSTETKPVQDALENGVLHYADTAQPGQDGNLVIVGHSSNNILNPGKYKFAFVLLHKLTTGDTFYLQKDGKRYVYEVYKREIISPTDTSILGAQDQPATASLITCDPPGTSSNRLVVIAKQISPSAKSNLAASGSNSAAVAAPIIPGNSPSLWSRLYAWLTH